MVSTQRNRMCLCDPFLDFKVVGLIPLLKEITPSTQYSQNFSGNFLV